MDETTRPLRARPQCQGIKSYGCSIRAYGRDASLLMFVKGMCRENIGSPLKICIRIPTAFFSPSEDSWTGFPLQQKYPL